MNKIIAITKIQIYWNFKRQFQIQISSSQKDEVILSVCIPKNKLNFFEFDLIMGNFRFIWNGFNIWVFFNYKSQALNTE